MRNNLTADGHPPAKDPYVNVLTIHEREKNDHKLDCPPNARIADHGEAIQCPHGTWFVFHLTGRSGSEGYGSRSGYWSPATRRDLRRIRKAL